MKAGLSLSLVALTTAALPRTCVKTASTGENPHTWTQTPSPAPGSKTQTTDR